jgi:Fur family ferric uptake transcriptional regulator
MEEFLERVEIELKKRGKKSSKIRRKVMELFFEKDCHVTVEELHSEVREKHSGIGYATVYRTLKILEELGYATSIEIGDGRKRFENGMSLHHDHLFCIHCKNIIEFRDPEIEILQEIIAKRHGFKIIDHSLYIFGVCQRCGK